MMADDIISQYEDFNRRKAIRKNELQKTREQEKDDWDKLKSKIDNSKPKKKVNKINKPRTLKYKNSLNSNKFYGGWVQLLNRTRGALRSFLNDLHILPMSRFSIVIKDTPTREFNGIDEILSFSFKVKVNSKKNKFTIFLGKCKILVKVEYSSNERKKMKMNDITQIAVAVSTANLDKIKQLYPRKK